MVVNHAVNCDTNCSCSITIFLKTFNTTINMTEPICFVGSLRKMIFLSMKIDQTWTLQGLFQNIGRGDWQESIALLKYLSGTFCGLRVWDEFNSLNYLSCNIWDYIQLTHGSLIIVRICVRYLITIIKSEVWPIWHYLGLDHEIMVCAVCLTIFSEIQPRIVKLVSLTDHRFPGTLVKSGTRAAWERPAGWRH